MKRAFELSITLLMYLILTAPLSAYGQHTTVYRFVGYSQNTTTGGAGLAGLYEACQATYGIGTRACTTKEILDTPNLPTVPNGQARVLPTIISVAGTTAVDISGVFNAPPSQMSCNGWNNVGQSDNSMAVFGPLLYFGPERCDILIPVACCAPAQ